jgi:hypothetical protein
VWRAGNITVAPPALSLTSNAPQQLSIVLSRATQFAITIPVSAPSFVKLTGGCVVGGVVFDCVAGGVVFACVGAGAFLVVSAGLVCANDTATPPVIMTATRNERRAAAARAREVVMAWQGPAQPSPALGDALNAGYLYLEVKCLGCTTHQTVGTDYHQTAEDNSNP